MSPQLTKYTKTLYHFSEYGVTHDVRHEGNLPWDLDFVSSRPHVRCFWAAVVAVRRGEKDSCHSLACWEKCLGHKMWSFLLGMLSLVSLGTSANFQRKIISGREKKGSVFFIILILWSLLYVKLCLLSPGDVAPSYYPHIPSNPLLTYRHLFLKKKFIGQMWWCMPVTQNMGCINRKISVI